MSDMPKVFNTTAVCIPEKHYMVDVSDKLDTILADYIEKGKYFTMNRARQYGKTTTLFLLEQRLKQRYAESYLAVRLSFEAADEMFASLYTLAAGLIRKISRSLKMQSSEEIPALLKRWEQPVSELFPLDDLSTRITELCRHCSKKIVLMIDEVDKNADNQIFLSFLGLLRSKYLEQQQGIDDTFYSVILAGVYDIKNLKIRLHPGVESKYNSPWNIAADFDVELSFSADDIAGMLKEYERDCHTGMDIKEMAGWIYDYTCGYPFLVSRLCKLLDEAIPGKDEFGTKALAWTRDGFSGAVKELLTESNTLFDDIVKQLSDYPELKRMLYGILFKGEKIPYNPDVHAVNIGCMFGFLKNDQNAVAVSNRIFESRLYEMFLAEDVIESRIYRAAALDKNQFIRDGQLDMERVLERFVESFHEIYADAAERFLEENGRRFFLLYLKPIINGVGNYYIEARTRDMRRTDVIIDYRGRQYVCELKIWHGDEYNRRGEQQLIGYLEDYHLDTGYMVSFNFNKKKQTGVHEIHLNGKTIIEAVV